MTPLAGIHGVGNSFAQVESGASIAACSVRIHWRRIVPTGGQWTWQKQTHNGAHWAENTLASSDGGAYLERRLEVQHSDLSVEVAVAEGLVLFR